MIRRLDHLPYEHRMLHLGLTTLKEQRTRCDIIEAYKVMTGREAVEREPFFQLSVCEYSLRGHSMKLSKQRASLDVCKFFFFVASRARGYYVCEPVQEPSGQVLAKIRASKACLNKPINRQVQLEVGILVISATCTSEVHFFHSSLSIALRQTSSMSCPSI